MDLIELRKNWDEFGRTDPMWAILTNPDKRYNKWEIKEFFQTGINEIDSVFDYLNSLNLRPNGTALDFGCGVGRLTQALCNYFEECYGIDIAKSMIDQAIKCNRHGNKCKYFVNESNDLTLFKDNRFDFIYTRLVLQHIREDYSKQYIKEFMRVLKPGGMLVFAMPSEPTTVAPLPDSAYNARIEPLDVPANLDAGVKSIVRVKVKNISDSVWPGLAESGYKMSINLGNHWLDKLGNLIINDDGRINIPSIKPNEEVELTLPITAPCSPGIYIIAFDLVLEGITWFAAKNMQPTTGIPIKIESQKIKNCPNLSTTIEPVMEIHGIPKNEILAIIGSAGGHTLDIKPDFSAAGWEGFRYCVTKN
jgi:SAM-dependent methyltransferase